MTSTVTKYPISLHNLGVLLRRAFSGWWTFIFFLSFIGKFCRLISSLEEISIVIGFFDKTWLEECKAIQVGVLLLYLKAYRWLWTLQKCQSQSFLGLWLQPQNVLCRQTQDLVPYNTGPHCKSTGQHHSMSIPCKQAKQNQQKSIVRIRLRFYLPLVNSMDKHMQSN